MKGFFYFILGLIVILGGISAFWWVSKGLTVDEQIDEVKAMLGSSVKDTAAVNTAESASKLGRVLNVRFDEAKDVYQNATE